MCSKILYSNLIQPYYEIAQYDLTWHTYTSMVYDMIQTNNKHEIQRTRNVI